MNIQQEIEHCIHKSKAGYRDWYIGLAINPQKQLFDGHNVSKKEGAWFYRNAGSEISARDLETLFLKKGCKGGSFGHVSSKYIYAYKMTRTTRGIRI